MEYDYQKTIDGYDFNSEQLSVNSYQLNPNSETPHQLVSGVGALLRHTIRRQD